MLRWICTSVVGLVLFMFQAQSAETPQPATESLIKQLGDKNFRVREKAGQSLEALGEAALPFLRKALQESDPEIHRRVEILTKKIERQVLLTPKKVTVKGEDLSAEEVVAQLRKQTGYQIAIQGQVKERMTYDFQDVPFWQVMHRFSSTGATDLS